MTEISIADVCCWIKNSIECPLCKGTGFVLMDEWQNPRSCPICYSVGQIKTRDIPTQEEMAVKMLYYPWK